MEKSICILSHSFTLDSASSFDEFQSALKTLPTSKNPITLVDPKKYYPHIYQNKGILNIEDQNIFQFEIAGLKKKDFSAIEDLLDKTIYLDDEKKIELDVSSIKWMFILDAKCELGFLFYIFDLEIRSENCLESLSKTKIFRYLKEPGKDPKNYMYKLKVCENEKIIGYTSFYSILTNCLGKLSDGLNFLEAKPLQFHFLGKSAFSNDFERESFCYKLLRIPANPNIEIDKKDISTTSMKNYLISMQQVFDEMSRVLKPKKYMAVIIGDNRKDGNIQPTFASFIQDATNRLELELKDIFVWVTKGKAGMNVTRRGNYIDHNYILIFKKP